MWLPLSFIKKTVTYAKISAKMMNPRAIAGNAEEEKEELCVVDKFKEVW